jgi:hypothetical protein
MGPCLPAGLAHACMLFRTSDGTLWQSSYAPPPATEAADELERNEGEADR